MNGSTILLTISTLLYAGTAVFFLYEGKGTMAGVFAGYCASNVFFILESLK